MDERIELLRREGAERGLELDTERAGQLVVYLDALLELGRSVN